MKLNPKFRREAEGCRELFHRIFRAAKVYRKRKPSEWATQARIMPLGGPIATDENQPYSLELMPHCVEPMDSADDQSARIIVLWWPIRDGKTTVCTNIIGRTVTDDPGGIFSVHPIQDDCDKFSADDIEPLIELSPELKPLFVDKKSREPGRTKSFKKFRAGSIRIVGAESLSKFRGSTVKVLCLHEADALNIESIYKALGRTKGLANAIIVMESTGTIAPSVNDDGTTKYNSVIHEWYEKGDQRQWFCPCQFCDELQTLKFDQLDWPEGRMDLATYRCEKCGEHHDEAHWRAMASAGKWIPTAKPKQPEVRSYWRNGLNSLLPHSKGYATKLHEFVAEMESAKSSPEAMRTWKNEIAAELTSSKDAETPPPYQPILDGREDYAVIPARGLVLTTMTDLHPDRLETEWRVWGRDGESWGMAHQVLLGDTNKPDIWRDWIQRMRTKWPHESGGQLGLNMAFVDAGWNADAPIMLLRLLRMGYAPEISGKVRLSKGTPDWSAIVSDRHGSIKGKVTGIHVGTWMAKRLIYERLAWHGGELQSIPWFIHFNKSYSAEFIRQCVSETPVMKITNAQEVLTFKNPNGNRNEGLDLLAGNLAAYYYGAEFGSWNYDRIERQLAGKPEPEADDVVVVGGSW